MITKEQFLGTVRHEIHICKHLFSKLDAGQFPYRTSEDTRSVDELLRYLTYCGIGPAESLISADWSTVGQRAQAVAGTPIEEFPALMDRQMEEIEAVFAGLSEKDLVEQLGTLPWGEKQPLGLAMVNAVLKFLTAYRMQLFLYAKQSGCTGLKTINCWLGADTREEVPA